MEVAVGEYQRSAASDVRQVRAVSLIKIHEDYVVGRRNDEKDIALLKLSTPITFNENVQPICAPDSSVDYTNRKVLTSGWGTVRSGKYAFFCWQASFQRTIAVSVYIIYLFEIRTFEISGYITGFFQS